MMRTVALVTALAALAAYAAPRVVGWRGDGTGRYPEATCPVTWSATENVRYLTPMPSWSDATPAPCGDRVSACAEPTRLLCLNCRGCEEGDQERDDAP